MSKATFVPAKTETKTIELEPAKVVLELTPEDAGKLRAVLGKQCCLSNVYAELGHLVHGGVIPHLRSSTESCISDNDFSIYPI